MKRFLIAILCLICANMSLRADPSRIKYVEESGLIEEGFVTFATSNYFSLLKVLLDSVKEFSTRPIVAFGINDDIPFSTEEYPFLIKRRIDLNLNEICIYYQKPRVIAESNLLYGIYVEADDILNEGVDELFEVAKSLEEYPICPIHPVDVYGQDRIMQAMGVFDRSMHYVHGHVIFSDRCKNFVQEWYDCCLKYGHLGPHADESVLNVMFWKYGVTNYVPIYDPFYQCIHHYKEGILIDWLPSKVHYLMFHGCKDPVEAGQILDSLILISKERESNEEETSESVFKIVSAF
jgi:hypothetical protein